MVGTIDTTMRRVMRECYITVRVRLDWRWRLGFWVMRFGARLAGFAGVKIEQE